jgi:hypothetical protein
MNDELKRVWKETVVAQSRYQSRNLLGEAEENKENIISA